jgi:hypothetical protein
MTSYFRSILGDMLYTEEVSEDMESLPSPRELRSKILIKGKKTQSSKSKSKGATETAVWHVEDGSRLTSSTIESSGRQSVVAVSVETHRSTTDGRSTTSTTTTKRTRVLNGNGLVAENSVAIVSVGRCISIQGFYNHKCTFDI